MTFSINGSELNSCTAWYWSAGARLREGKMIQTRTGNSWDFIMETSFQNLCTKYL